MTAGSSRVWLPHVAPYAVFLILVELGRWTPGGAALWLPLKVAIPAAVLVGLALGGCFPELRAGHGTLAGWLADAAVGLGVAALWMLPYGLGVLPGPSADAAFDPTVLGVGREPLALALRVLGFAAVTPFVEELFVRSFLLRFAETLSFPGGRLEQDGRDFRTLPIAHFTRWSFWITVAWFTLSHAAWEMPVAFATGVAYNLWLYRRGHLGAVIRAHAVTNLAIFVAVLLAARQGIDLWYFL